LLQDEDAEIFAIVGVVAKIANVQIARVIGSQVFPVCFVDSCNAKGAQGVAQGIEFVEFYRTVVVGKRPNRRASVGADKA